MVTPLVNPVRPPRIFEEKDDTLFTTEAANAEPGIFGIEMVGRLPLVPTDGAEAVVGIETVVEGRVKFGS